MALEQRAFDKPELTDENLRDCGIYYEPRVYKGSKSADENPLEYLPAHVNNVRKSLLEFENTIHPEYAARFAPPGARKPQKSAWLKLPAVTASEKQRETIARDDTAHSIEVADIFEEQANSDEAAWTQVMLERIFKPFRRTELADQTGRFQEWRLAQNLHWNEFSRWDNVDAEIQRRRRLTGPKPDITYGFPIYKPDDDLPAALSIHDWAHLFSYNYLRGLRIGSLRLKSAPNTGLSSATKSVYDLNNPQLLCYPWAVVELKHAKVPPRDTEFCYRQAANATAAALDIQEALFKETHKHLCDGTPLGFPPIVAFTCVGANIRVWLAYVDYKKSPDRKNMRCIYSTNLRSPWGVLSTCLIIKNMHLWACQNVRYKVSTSLYLTQLKNYNTNNNNNNELQGPSKARKKPLRISSEISTRNQTARATPEGYESDIPMSPIDAPVGLFDFGTGALRSDTVSMHTKLRKRRGSRKSEPGISLRSIDEEETYSQGHRYESVDGSDENSRKHDTVHFHSTTSQAENDSNHASDDDDDNTSNSRVNKEQSSVKTGSSKHRLPFRAKPKQQELRATSRDESSESSSSRHPNLEHHDSNDPQADDAENVSAQSADLGLEDDIDLAKTSNSDDEEEEEEQEEQDSAEDDDEEEEVEDSTQDDKEDDSIEEDEQDNVSTDDDSCEVPSPGSKELGTKQKAATTDDVADIRRRALEALDGPVFTNLPTFKKIVDKTSNAQILFAIESCLFVSDSMQLRNEWKKTRGNTTHNNMLSRVAHDLNSGLYGYSRITMSGQRGQSNLIDEALWDLVNDDRSEELYRIFTNLLSCYRGHHVVDVLTSEHFRIEWYEWAKMEEEALDIIEDTDPTFYRQCNKNMRDNPRLKTAR